VRFLGITGHADPASLLEGLRRVPFEKILVSLNAADRHHLSFAAELLPTAVEREMGIIAMKIPARSRILASWTPPPADRQRRSELATRAGTLTMREALYYTLSHPVSTVIIGCDTVAQLEENVQLASEFTPLSEAQLSGLAEKTAGVARQALFFRPWT